MKEKFLIIFFSLAFIFLAIYFFPRNSALSQLPEINSDKVKALKEEILPFEQGETISYAVKLGGIKIGNAELTYKGKTKLNDKDAHLIIFSTDTLNFKDTETMYAALDTFLPLKIERDINKWGKKIRIVEEYDQLNHKVKITQFDKTRNQTKEIAQDAQIQNVILLTYFLRKLSNFELGREFAVTLPLAKLIMRFTKEEQARIPCGVYRTYLAESFPKGHKIWFESSEKAIPIRISGPSIAGKVNMVMMDYKER
ncbi:MAG: DUF3108 domain-containing protein [Candidatus Omnitrophota bacterium]